MTLCLCGPACGPKTKVQSAGEDQDIARDILWAYKQDGRARFEDVRATCVNRVVTLMGRVPDKEAAEAAVQIALSWARGGRVVSQVEIRPR